MDKKSSAAHKEQTPGRREVLGLDDFTEADLAALKASRAPEWTKAFDHEMDDDTTPTEARR